MKNRTPLHPQPTSPVLAENLPSWQELPQDCQLELIQALADLLLAQPELQALLDGPHEPEQ